MAPNLLPKYRLDWEIADDNRRKQLEALSHAETALHDARNAWIENPTRANREWLDKITKRYKVLRARTPDPPTSFAESKQQKGLWG